MFPRLWAWLFNAIKQNKQAVMKKLVGVLLMIFKMATAIAQNNAGQKIDTGKVVPFVKELPIDSSKYKMPIEKVDTMKNKMPVVNPQKRKEQAK